MSLPSDPFHHFIQAGVAALNAGDQVAAETPLRAAVGIAPRDDQAHNLLGLALLRLGRAEAAAASFRTALDINRRRPDYHSNLGNALCAAGEFADADKSFRAALKIDPRSADAHLGLAESAVARGRFDEAAAACETILRRTPTLAAAWMCLARSRERQGLATESLDAWRRAVAANPQDVVPHYGLGLRCLALGLFEEGWREYQFRTDRWFHFQQLGQLPPVWQDSPLPADLRGTTLNLFQEQGIGDVLFFLRFAVPLAARGARLTLDCDARLAAIAARSGVFAEIRPHDLAAPPPGSVPVGDLPFLAGRPFGTPPSFPLRPLDAMRRTMGERLAAAGPPPYVGIAWRSGVVAAPGSRYSLGTKEIEMTELAKALRDTPGTLVCLQRNPAAGEIAAFATAAGRPVADFSAVNDDLEAMLGLLAELDTMVGVSNANVHLRAAQGGGGHTLVPQPAEWRWLSAGDVSPWFPAFSVYRQASDGDWTAALRQLRDNLVRN